MEDTKAIFKKILEEKKAANAELIVKTLAEGTSPLLKPTNEMADAFGNVNLLSFTKYRGINDLLLESKAADLNSKHTAWFTFAQAKELGGVIKKGAKGQEVLFYHRGRSDEEIKDLLEQLDELGEPHPSQEEIEQLQKTYSKSMIVFNVSQIDLSKSNENLNDYIDEFPMKASPRYDIGDIELLEEKFAEAIKNNQEHQDTTENYLPDHIRFLQHSVARFIIARSANAELKYTEEDKARREFLVESARAGLFSNDDVSLALKKGNEIAQRVLPTTINNTLTELQVNQVKNAFDFIKNNMREKGKNYYSAEIWKELFNIERKALAVARSGYSVDVGVKQLDDFLQKLENYEPKQKTNTTQEAITQPTPQETPAPTQQAQEVQQSKTPFSDRLKAMPKPSAEIEAKGKEFLNELRQSRNADSKSVAESTQQASAKSEVIAESNVKDKNGNPMIRVRVVR